MKKILALLLTLCMLAALAACGTEPAVTEPTGDTTTEPAVSTEDTTASTEPERTPASYSVATLKGPTGMGLASLMDKAEAREKQKAKA